jgi:4'-phosphopantetheinyl transferase
MRKPSHILPADRTGRRYNTRDVTREENLTPAEVHVWLVHPERVTGADVLASYHRLLSPDERSRHDRFAVAAARQAFLIGRALVRTRLSLYVDVPPARWVFQPNPHGRPEIVEPTLSTPLYFNLTHTRGLIACVVARLPAVGVDAEDLTRTLRDLAIAERYFSPEERNRLAGLPEDRRRGRFFAYWTLKESYLKARGTGLALGLSLLSFDVDQDPPRASFDPQLADDPASWQFALLRPDPQHLVALSLRRGRAGDLALRIRERRPLLDD